MIAIQDLEFRYPAGDFLLRVPSLAVDDGRHVAFAGPSGSGKTTLLNLIAGIALPQRGRIAVNGVEIAGLADAARRRFRARHIGMVFQEFELVDYLSVLDNILLPYRISDGLALDAAVRRRAAELADGVGLGSKLRRPAGRLSHGERQRVAVCRALVTNPSLLLADEPTGSLDPSNKERVLDILIERARGLGATLLMVTHDRDLLARFGRVIDFTQFHSRSCAEERPA